MKRVLLIVIAVLIVSIVGILGSCWLLGTATEAGLHDYLAKVKTSTASPALQGANFEVDEYKRGFFQSRATTSVKMAGTDNGFTLTNEIFHGPVAVTPDGLKLSGAYVISTLQRDSLDESSLETLNEIYGEKEPFIVKTNVSLSGERTSELAFTPVDHSNDKREIRFDGGSGTFTSSEDETEMEGRFQILPFSLRSKEESSPSRIRFGGIQADAAITEKATRFSWTVGETSLAIGGEDAVTLEFSGAELKGDVTKDAPESVLMLGGGRFQIPHAKIHLATKGSAEMTGLAIDMKSTDSGGLVTAQSDYSVESLALTITEPSEDLPDLTLLKNGAQMSFSVTLPRDILEGFTAFQQNLATTAGPSTSFTAPDLSPEKEKELAVLLESSLRKISAGTGLGVTMRFGSPEEGILTSLAYTYTGERPLTTQKTLLDIVTNSELRLDSRIPKSLLEGFPDALQTLQPLLATGALKENGVVLESKFLVKDGKATANGEPNPLLDSLTPFLQTEIPWDSIFIGMRSAAEADASEATEEK